MKWWSFGQISAARRLRLSLFLFSLGWPFFPFDPSSLSESEDDSDEEDDGEEEEDEDDEERLLPWRFPLLDFLDFLDFLSFLRWRDFSCSPLPLLALERKISAKNFSLNQLQLVKTTFFSPK